MTTLTLNRPFDKNKLHLIPPQVLDWGQVVEHTNVNIDVRETYVQKLEAVRDYCNSILDIHEKNKRVFPRKRK